jgi:hypothetical protein
MVDRLKSYSCVHTCVYAHLYFKNLACYRCKYSRIRVIVLAMAQPAAHPMVDPIQCMPGSLCAVANCGERSGAFVNEHGERHYKACHASQLYQTVSKGRKCNEPGCGKDITHTMGGEWVCKLHGRARGHDLPSRSQPCKICRHFRAQWGAYKNDPAANMQLLTPGTYVQAPSIKCVSGARNVSIASRQPPVVTSTTYDVMHQAARCGPRVIYTPRGIIYLYHIPARSPACPLARLPARLPSRPPPACLHSSYIIYHIY